MPLPQSLLVTLIVPRVLSLLSWKTERGKNPRWNGWTHTDLWGQTGSTQGYWRNWQKCSLRHFQRQKVHKEETYMGEVSKRQVYEGLESSFFSWMSELKVSSFYSQTKTKNKDRVAWQRRNLRNWLWLPENWWGNLRDPFKTPSSMTHRG